MPNTRTKLTFGLLTLSLIGLRPFGSAQDSKGPTDEEMSGIRTKFTDPSWEKRCDAFYGLLGYESAAKWDGRTYLIPQKLTSVFRTHPERENEIRLALIDLLSTENAKVEEQNREVKKTGKTLTEGYITYYGDLIAAVAGLNDPRAMNGLVGAITTGGMADRGLAQIGPAVLDPLMLQLQSRDVIIRAAAVRALTTLWQPEYRSRFSDDGSRQRIKAALLKSAADEDGGVRLAAVYGLALMPDPDTIPVLKTLATSDPSRLQGQADEGGPFYPVRQAARRALDQIAHTGLSTPTTPQ
jgi:hypothetical protein